MMITESKTKYSHHGFCVFVYVKCEYHTMLAFPLLLLHHKSTVVLSYAIIFRCVFSISSDIFSDYVHHVPAANSSSLPFYSFSHLTHRRPWAQPSLWDFIPFQPIYDAIRLTWLNFSHVRYLNWTDIPFRTFNVSYRLMIERYGLFFYSNV